MPGERISRNLGSMTASAAKEQFDTVYKAVNDLAYNAGRDSQFLRQAIDDAKFYLKTLTKEWGSIRPAEIARCDEADIRFNHSFKDLFGIRINILRSRLTDLREIVENIVSAQESNSDSDLLMLYSIKRRTLEEGLVHASNMRDAIESTFQRAINNPPYPTQMRFKHVPGALLDPRSNSIMSNPVKITNPETAGVAGTYEESSIKEFMDERAAATKGVLPHTIQFVPDTDRLQMLNYFNMHSQKFKEELQKSQPQQGTGNASPEILSVGAQCF